MWHAEASALVLRLYAEPGGYERREPFIGVAFAKHMGPDAVFIEGALRVDGRPLSPSHWRSLARMLRDEHGVKTIHAIRHGRPYEVDTSRAG